MLAVSTGDEEGYIEVVLNSDTTANITKAAGGARAELLDNTVFSNWLRDQNRGPVQSKTRVPLFAARTLNATGQYRVTLSLW